MIGRRHPTGLELTAWYDGELEDRAVTGHVAACHRCHHLVADMASVDAAIKGDRPEAARGWSRRRRRSTAQALTAVAAAAALVFVVAAGVPGSGWGGFAVPALHSIEGSNPVPRRPNPPTAEPVAPARPVNPPAGPGGVSRSPTRPAPGAAGAVGGLPPPPRPAAPALALATVVPMVGPDAPSGAEVVRAVRAAVAEANAAGGVDGQPVRLDVIPAESASSADFSTVSALVGGFGTTTTPGVPWLMPSDPLVVGASVVTADPSPTVAGATLGSALIQRSPSAVVGVVRATGTSPESGLADGLRTATATVEVSADPDSTCLEELYILRSRHVTALAVAGPAGLVARCLDAAANEGWRPRDGLLVPPSAAYSGIAGFPSASGAETLLGLPWPTTGQDGARRFHSLTGSSSYPAEVAFAATELAVQIARADGAINLQQMATAVWDSDLYQYRGTNPATTHIVHALGGVWES